MMSKGKRIALIVFTIIVTLAALYVFAPGFSKQGSAYITGYSVTDDGTEVTLKVGVASSIGYIRKVTIHQQQGGKLYLDCYSAFGGINGSIGAKSEYTISLDEDTKMIAFYRAANSYSPVLEKDESGQWKRVTSN